MEHLQDWQLPPSALRFLCRDCRGIPDLHLPQGTSKLGVRALGLLWSLSSGLGSFYFGSQCPQWPWTLQKFMETDAVFSRNNDMPNGMVPAVPSQPG